MRPEPVLDHALRAGLAGEPLVVRELEPFLAGVVDAGEAEHVAVTSPPGSSAGIRAAGARPGCRVADRARVLRAHVAREVDEVAVEVAA